MLTRAKQIARWLFSRETCAYLFFGVATALVNLLVFRLLLSFALDYKLSNLAALLCSKLFAFVVNKRYVFRSKTENAKDFFMELLRFIFSRAFTAIVDYFGLIVLVEVLKTDVNIAKCIVVSVVIILNYFLSKMLVFRKSADSKKPVPGDSTQKETMDSTEESGEAK